MDELRRVLARVGELSDLDAIEDNLKMMRDAWRFKSINRPPLTLNFPPPIKLHNYKYREAFEDPAKMLINQLEGNVYPHLMVRDDAVPSVRADYGIVVIPSAFGCRVKVPEDDMPWITGRVLGDGRPNPDCLGEPIFDEGLPARVLETERFFLEALEDTGVHVYLADTQGPFNIAHHLMGENIFISIYRYPEELKEVLTKTAKAYIDYSRIQKEVIGEPLNEGAHGWDRRDGPSGIWMGLGGVRLCDDSAAMLSPRHFKEFCAPYNSRCLKPFDGGMWHSCGRVNHILPTVVETEGVKAINLGNPEMHSFREVRELTYRRGICLIWKDSLKEGSDIRSFVDGFVKALDGEYRGVIFSIDVPSIKEAEKLKSIWMEAFT